MQASLVSQWDGIGRCWSTPPALRIRTFAAHCRRVDKFAPTPLSGLCRLELVPPASSDGSSGVSDFIVRSSVFLGVVLRARDDHCPMGGSDDTNTGYVCIPVQVFVS